MFDPLNNEATSRDYSLPVEEKEVKSLNEGYSNKNYVFNNCSVTINEEGKAIDILQEQEKQKAKMQELQVKMVGEVMTTITSTITSLLERKAERMRKDMAENTGEPVMTDLKSPKRKRASAKKKAPAKKVTKIVAKKK